MYIFSRFLILFLSSSMIYAANQNAVIDTVYSYKFGNNTQYGQSEKFFPKNIFSLPPNSASKDAPASSEEDICSLGLGGEIILGFKNKIILNQAGPDFTIFENAFINPVNKKMFAEPAVISVSQDGIKYIDFPFDSSSLLGCAGINYTNGNKDLFNSLESGGDQFDIEKLGLSYIKYIKIKDITQFILDNPKHKYYDAILSGFDLDCIIAYNLADESTEVEMEFQNLTINESNELIYINNLSSEISINIYNINGLNIFHDNIYSNYIINKSDFSTGIYYLTIISKNSSKLYKFYTIK
jgi:hypothetical protein